MLGNKNTQASFLDIESWCSQPLVDPNSIYGLMTAWGDRLIKDEDYEDLYSHTGRPSVSPALLSKVLILMYHENISDREAEERAKYDLRWKVALQLPMNESGFDYSALSRFRARLVLNKKQKLVFERFVRLAKEAGIIKDDALQVVDSTRILGAAAVQDTFTLIKTGIQKLLKVCRKKGGKANQIIKDLKLNLDYGNNGKEKIDWTDTKARQELLNKLVNDSHKLLASLKDAELSSEEQATADILRTVTEQDIQATEDNQVSIKQGVTKDRIISVNDSEMRHGHKSSSGKFNGHKGQIIIDEATEIITNVSVTPGNQVDGEALSDLLETSIVKPGKLIGDTAYGTMNAREIIEKHEVTPVAPLPKGPKNSTKFSKYDFKINFEHGTCECPAKEISTQTRKHKGQIIEFVFPKQTCNRCPLRDQCTSHGKGRRVAIKPDEERRRIIISRNNTEEFKALYRLRPKVERKIAHMVRRGLRKSRYIGKAKTLLQSAFIAAGVNLKRIFAVATGDPCALLRLQKALNSI